MSISVENLSLLGALTPLRRNQDSTSAQAGRGFAGKLDNALGSGDSLASGVGGKAVELAESLTLQMLQSSLALAGDSASGDSLSTKFTPFSPVSAILQAYRATLAEGGEPLSQPHVASPSQLKDMIEGAPTTTVAPNETVSTSSGTSWFDPIILKASQKYGVDAGLIKAVIKAESGFNPKAVSPAGARGLMQLMPATARSLGVSDSFDPEQNVMGGTRFLKDMLQRYNGNVDDALAAYNWGPGNVDRNPDHLPRETRNYLARVKQLYDSYSA